MWLPPADPTNFDLAGSDLDAVTVLQDFSNELMAWPEEDFNRETLAKKTKEFSKQHKFKYGLFMKLLRSTLSGAKVSKGYELKSLIIGKRTLFHGTHLC